MILLQLTDLHVRPRGKPAMRVCETNMLTERALLAVRNFRPRPDALVITGDLAHNGQVSEYRNLADMLARLIDLPTYVIPGNHDDRDNFRQVLGHLPGIAGHPDFIHYAVEDLPVRLVMLDTLIPGRTEGELCPHRLEWLDAALALQPDKPTIIAMHHPPFRCGIRHMDQLMLRDPAGVADLQHLADGDQRPVDEGVFGARDDACPAVEDLARQVPQALDLRLHAGAVHKHAGRGQGAHPG